MAVRRGATANIEFVQPCTLGGVNTPDFKQGSCVAFLISCCQEEATRRTKRYTASYKPRLLRRKRCIALLGVTREVSDTFAGVMINALKSISSPAFVNEAGPGY